MTAAPHPVDPNVHQTNVTPDLLRVRFTKRGPVRFTGHRDVARIWERAVRRAGVPVAYTQGFSPRARLSFGLALPTAYESDGEYVDIVVAHGTQIDADEAVAALDAALPDGMDATAALVTPRGGPSLQEMVVTCGWRVELAGARDDEVSELAERLLATTSLPFTREHKGKVRHVDLRSMLRDARPAGPGRLGPALELALDAAPFVARPGQLLATLEPPVADPAMAGGLVRRTHQWIDDDRTIEPLGGALVAVAAGHAVPGPTGDERHDDQLGRERQ